MGAVTSKDDYEFCDLQFSYCEACYLPQINKKIDFSKLYFKNHNIDIVGTLWMEHFLDFSKFCAEEVQYKEILEIGDPSAKLASKLSDTVKKWDIYEPNSYPVNVPNVVFYEEFFVKPTDKKYDCVISSHVLEHQYDPIEFLRNCAKSLKQDGKLIFSVPDMGAFLKNNINPVTILNFEHIYYLDINVIFRLLDEIDFKIEKIQYFKNHSIFIMASNKGSFLSIGKDNHSHEFDSLYNKTKLYKSYIDKLLNCVSDDVYIYGCHVTSQCLINSGVQPKRLFDNSSSKNNKYLYGTNLKSEFPYLLKNEKSQKVITSHSGIYRQEIEKNIKEINPSIICV